MAQKRSRAKTTKVSASSSSPKRRPAGKKPARTKGPKPQSAADRQSTLAAVFQALGAHDPKRWAQRQVQRGSDEIGRFVLLRALWLKVVEPGRLLARAQQNAASTQAVNRLLAQAGLADLDALIRVTQELALKDALSVLDDSADDNEGIGWGVFRKDAQGLPAARLSMLADDVEATRP